MSQYTNKTFSTLTIKVWAKWEQVVMGIRSLPFLSCQVGLIVVDVAKGILSGVVRRYSMYSVSSAFWTVARFLEKFWHMRDVRMFWFLLWNPLCTVHSSQVGMKLGNCFVMIIKVVFHKIPQPGATQRQSKIFQWSQILSDCLLFHS